VFFHPLRGLKIPRAFSPAKSIYRDEGGLFENVIDVSIAYKIIGTHMWKSTENQQKRLASMMPI
jgi:hypothetical protein